MAEDGLEQKTTALEPDMPATQAAMSDLDIDPPVVLGPVDAREEDAFWQRTFWRERYYSPQFEYEDYAPAYCVGYIGYAQYGGDYEDAEKSLWANWLRIKGDSRLGRDEARQAMRAAWDRMANRSANQYVKKAISVRLLRQRLRAPSFKLSPASLR
jgi:hypothetical protein